MYELKTNDLGEEFTFLISHTDITEIPHHMNTTKTIIRTARPEDATIIAQTVAMAIGDEIALFNYCGEDYLDVLTEIAHSEGTQYSWQNALIAEFNGVVAGAVVGYNGAKLEELRSGTLTIVNRCTGRTPMVIDETSAEEYYLDSVAVIPEFRGNGIGSHLVNAFCEKAFGDGAQRVGLIVDTENPTAEQLYTSLGFECVGTREFFGHQMRHLQRYATA